MYTLEEKKGTVKHLIQQESEKYRQDSIYEKLAKCKEHQESNA